MFLGDDEPVTYPTFQSAAQILIDIKDVHIIIDDIPVGPGFCAEKHFFISNECSGSLSCRYRQDLKVFLLSSEESRTIG
jgi:hypothetical protein